jgi:arsenite methyltransferase
VVRLAFTEILETKRVPEGLRLERYLRFAFARKPDGRSLARLTSFHDERVKP